MNKKFTTLFLLILSLFIIQPEVTPFSKTSYKNKKSLILMKSRTHKQRVKLAQSEDPYEDPLAEPEEIESGEDFPAEPEDLFDMSDEEMANTDFTLLSENLSKTLKKVLGPLYKPAEKIILKAEEIVNDLKKGIIKIKPIGILKFRKFDPSKDKFAGDTRPAYIGVLYDGKGTKARRLNAGLFKITEMRVLLNSLLEPPRIEFDAVVFKKKGTVTLTSITTNSVELFLKFDTPLRIPVGLKSPGKLRLGELNNFKIFLEKDGEKYMESEAILFGSKQTKPSKVKVDLSEKPYELKITTVDLPLSAVSSLTEKKLLAKMGWNKVLITVLNLSVKLFPMSVSLTGEANVSSLKTGIGLTTETATFNAYLGKDGFDFAFKVENVNLPKVPGIGSIGKIDEAIVRIKG